jgi:hypothetical protein
MPDWMKGLTTSRASDLAGEDLIAATYFLGLGSTGGQILFGALTAVGGAAFNLAAVEGRAAVMKSQRDSHDSPTGSLAASIPDSKGILAVTDRNLIVFGYHQGIFTTRIEAPVTRIGRDRLVGWALQPGRMASVLNLAFDDGSTQGIELPVANKPAHFAASAGIPVIS